MKEALLEAHLTVDGIEFGTEVARSALLEHMCDLLYFGHPPEFSVAPNGPKISGLDDGL
jgi:hypothetical protein